MKRTFQSLKALNSVSRPILLDHIGGLVGIGALALGIVSGIAHGIGERERFDARAWHKRPKERDPDSMGGRALYIPAPSFDRSFLRKDIDLIASAAGGRRIISCGDPRCCSHGLNSALKNPKSHIAYQRLTSVRKLAQVPDRHRANHFLDNEMRSAERKARDLSKLKTGDENLNVRLAKGRKRIDSLARTFETLVPTNDDEFPLPVIRRTEHTNVDSMRTI